MHLISSIGCRQVVFVIGAALVLSGCAISASSSGRSTVTASLSYEMPMDIDVKSVVDFLEATSVRALRGPVIVEEGVASFRSEDTIYPVTLQEKITALEGLGEVAIPSVSCPGALAAIHKLIPSEKGLRLVAGRVTIGVSATRIDLLDVTTGHTPESTHSALSLHATASSPILRIGAAFVEQFPAIHLIDTPDIPIRRGVNRGPDGAFVSPSIPHKAVALVCFGPNTKGISVRDNPDDEAAVGTLDFEMIVQAEDPSTYSFLHITTREGQADWVKRTDIRWLPCPIV